MDGTLSPGIGIGSALSDPDYDSDPLCDDEVDDTDDK
jgi:hypothetical protein